MRQIGKQGNCFPVSLLHFFPFKYPKNGSRASVFGKFVVFLVDIPEKSRIFGNKIKLVLEQIQLLTANIVLTDSAYGKIIEK